MRLDSYALPVLLLAALSTAPAGAHSTIPTIPTIPILPGFNLMDPPASGIVAAPDGTVYFVDSFSNTVWRTQPGRGTTAFVTGRNGRTLQIDALGNVYGTHQEARGRVAVWRATPDGTVRIISRLAVPDSHGTSLLIDAKGAVIGSTGSTRRSGVRIWRAQQHEQRLIAGGEWGHRDGGVASARFYPVGSMTLDTDGNLLVAAGHTVRRIAGDGTVSTVAAGDLLTPKLNVLSRLLNDVQGHLTGMTVAGNGDIYVTNSARNVVLRISGEGVVEEVAASDPGWTPTGITIAGGQLFVLEYGAGVRVRHISADGTTGVLAAVRSSRAVAAGAFLQRLRA